MTTVCQIYGAQAQTRALAKDPTAAVPEHLEAPIVLGKVG